MNVAVPRAAPTWVAEPGPSGFCGADGTVHQGDDCAGDGRRAADVEPASGAGRGLVEQVPGQDDGGE